jgi:hypothetical protein
MTNLVVRLPLQNESTAAVKLILEPLSEFFWIQPGQKVEITAVCDDKTSNTHFTIAPNDDALVVYAPGEIAGFVDCFVTCNGARMKPDGN